MYYLYIHPTSKKIKGKDYGFYRSNGNLLWSFDLVNRKGKWNNEGGRLEGEGMRVWGYKSSLKHQASPLSDSAGFHLLENMFIPSHQVWLVGLLAFSLVGAEYYDTKTADKDFLLKQKKVYNLLYRVAQPALANITWYNEGQAWNIEANIDSYTDAVSNRKN